jgi:hypothetical protein
MQFIEMSGKTLLKLANADEAAGLKKAGITEQSLVRINRQGDIEVRHRGEWGIVGGLLGDFETRVKHATGLDWADTT